jgi:antitoxin (DNA-binding transcriptional repressor) of toxin-antitoxin stability system
LLHIVDMKTMPVGELKAQFSEVLEKVKQGESFGILYGRKKKPIAMIVPYIENKKKKDRSIGLLDGKINIKISEDFQMTEEELLGLK